MRAVGAVRRGPGLRRPGLRLVPGGCGTASGSATAPASLRRSTARTARPRPPGSAPPTSRPIAGPSHRRGDRQRLGGGRRSALGADIRIVAPDAAASVLEIRLGLDPNMTGQPAAARTGAPRRGQGADLHRPDRRVGTEAVTIGLATRTDPDRGRWRPWSCPRDRGRSRTRSGRERLLNLAGRSISAFAASRRQIAALIGSPNAGRSRRRRARPAPPRFHEPDQPRRPASPVTDRRRFPWQARGAVSGRRAQGPANSARRTILQLV